MTRHLAPAIQIDNVSCFYGDTTVLRDVSVELETGSWLGLIGPNGAGKSSLLRSIINLGQYEGTMLFHGEKLSRAQLAKRIAYLPQNPSLPSGMTVAEYVLLGRTAHLGWFERETQADRDISLDSLARLELGPFADRFVTDLSGGEAQRVSLARVLAQQADIVLLDEPTSALDIGHQQSVLAMVNSLRLELGLTVVAALHDLTAAGRFCDELLLLHKGTAVAHGSADKVLTSKVLSSAYETDVTVINAPDGSRVVLALG